MSLPIRYQLVGILVGVNLIGVAVVAVFAYQRSRQSLEDQERLAVGSVAEARRQAVVRLLERRQERLTAVLASVESLCGERNPRGRLGLERECIRVALGGLRTSERATAVELRLGQRRLTVRGSWPEAIASPEVGALAAMTTTDGQTEYTMRAQRGRLVLRARFSLRDLEPIFQDRSGLRENGEVVLVDAAGSSLTALRFARAPADNAPPIESIQRCLSGDSGEMLTRDYENAAVISAFRPTAEMGGGCVVANLQYADALVPIRRLGRTFVYASAGIALFGIVLSFVLGHAIASPIRRLATSAQAIQEGRFDQPSSEGGPAEVRQLAGTFSAMARAIGDLVQREHAARLDAEAASRLKDEFLSTLSHELRTPLTTILGWTSISMRAPMTEEQAAHAIEVIERSARTQARLVDELLDISHLVSGQTHLNPSDVSLTVVVEKALDAVRPAANAKNLALVKLIETPPRIVHGDAPRLQQILWNLLSNAVRFTPEGGRIVVTVRDVDQQAEIRVVDTGIGIPREFLPHVFERFRQADASTTRSYGGLGLGLALTRHLVELHGGTIAVESAGEGRGAVFTVRLPIRTALSVVATAC